MHPHPTLDYDRAPFLLIWEITQACALACRHCRAEAIDQRDPDELTTREGKNLVDQVADMGTPIIVFTGGDPLQREDLEDLIRHAKHRNLRAGTIPAGTDRLTRQRVQGLKDAGCDQMAVSFDGSNREIHDSFRQVEGSYDKTIAGANYAREIGIPLQVNTCFCEWNFDDFDNIAKLVEDLGIVFWEVFFLVPTGRGSELKGFSAERYEEIFAKLYELQQRVSFIIKVTEAPHYRRYVMQQTKSGPQGPGPRTRDLIARPSGPGGSVGMAPKAVNSGTGFCFVAYNGDVYPSGFLPVTGGSIRKQPLADIYRDSPIFREMREPSILKGRCGRCEYVDVCGGSRSRAFAITGDYLAEDPCCIYESQPQTLTKSG